MYLSPSVWVVLHCLLHKHPSPPQGPRHTRRCRGCVAHSRILYFCSYCICIWNTFVFLAHLLNWRSHSRFSMMGTYASIFIATVRHKSNSSLINIHRTLWTQLNCFDERKKEERQNKEFHLNFSQRIWHQGSWLLNLKNCCHHRNPDVMWEITGKYRITFWLEFDHLIENHDYKHHEPFPTQWPMLLTQQSGVGRRAGRQALCAAGYKFYV